jgi:hypothetical protein
VNILRRYILHNFALKLMAVALAVMLWMAVGRNPASLSTPAAPPAANSK